MSSFSGEDKSNDNQSSENNLRKGPWTAEEDAILAAYVTQHGPGNWNIVQQNTGLLRCGKSCRLRWTNHLRPDLRRGAFSKEEQSKVIQLHALMGNKWAKMAQEIPGRTDNEIKNFWNTRLKKRKRIGLELYPDGIKPMSNAPKQNCLELHQDGIKPVFNGHNPDDIKPVFNAHNVGTSSEHAVFNNFGNTQSQPLCVQPISMVREDMKPPMIPEEMQREELKVGTSFGHAVFNNFGNTQNQPICVQPISMIRQDMKPPVIPKEMQCEELKVGTSFGHAVFNNFGNIQNQPLCVQPISMVRGDMKPPMIPEEMQREELKVGTSNGHAVFNNFGNTQNQPLCVQPISMVRGDMKPPMIPKEMQCEELKVDTSFGHPVLNNFGNTQNQPLCVQPISMVREDMKPPVIPKEMQCEELNVDTSFGHAVLNNFGNTQNQPLCAQPISMVREGISVTPEEMQLLSELREELELREAGTSSYVQPVGFNNSSNTPNQPLYVQPISMLREDMKLLSVNPEQMQLHDVPQELQPREACTSSCVPRVVFNNSNNTQNQPLYAQPISMVREIPEETKPSDVHEEPQLPEQQHMSEVPEQQQFYEVPQQLQLPRELKGVELHDFDKLPGGCTYNNYACSGGPSSVSGLPPLPASCDDLPFEESMIVRDNSQFVFNPFYEPRSPRSNGYLESIFYPPKVLPEPDDFPMQGELNLGNTRENSDQKKPENEENEDGFGDLIWIQKHDGASHNGSVGIVHPFLKP